MILEFVLTHGPGRSKRFSTGAELQRALLTIAPGAIVDTTFPLKEPAVHSSEKQLAGKILGLLSLAKKLIQAHDERTAIGLISRALEYDCGVQPNGEYGADRKLIRAYLPLLFTNGRCPATFAGLSEIFHEWRDRDTSIRLLKRYVQIATELPIAERLWLSLRLQFQLRSRYRTAIAWLSCIRSNHSTPPGALQQKDKGHLSGAA